MDISAITEQKAERDTKGLVSVSQSILPKQLLNDAFAVAVDTVSPRRCLPAFLPPLTKEGKTVIIAVGKAAGSMTRAVLDHYGRDLPGIVLTRYGHGVSGLSEVEGLEVIEAGHPVPDEAGAEAARKILRFAEGLKDGDQVLFLVSGGGSSLLALPAEGLSLADKQNVTRQLLECGASIREINCVRKHLSAIKGGRLALAAHPAKVITLCISDVAGDDPAMVASGPTLPDETTLHNAERILKLYNLDLPEAVEEALSDPVNETPTAAHPAFSNAYVRVVARAETALQAAGQLCAAHGYQPVYLGDDVEGNATETGTVHAALALHYRSKAGRYALISGGECTVRINDRDGAGGPNAEYLMALAIALQGQSGVHALACDTDGIDGTEDNAGAIIDPTTLLRASKLGLDMSGQLMHNRSYETFEALGDLIVTGPTRTNVNDLRIILTEG